MYKLNMFQEIFVKVDKCLWWDIERIQTGARMQFTSNEFHEGLSLHVVQLELAASYHQ